MLFSVKLSVAALARRSFFRPITGSSQPDVGALARVSIYRPIKGWYFPNTTNQRTVYRVLCEYPTLSLNGEMGVFGYRGNVADESSPVRSSMAQKKTPCRACPSAPIPHRARQKATSSVQNLGMVSRHSTLCTFFVASSRGPTTKEDRRWTPLVAHLRE